MENGKSRLQKAQDEAEEVKVIMLENVNKAAERSGKLEDLDERADELLEQSKNFKKKSDQVKRKKMWENKKMKIIFGVAGSIFVIVVVGLIIFACVP